MSRSGSLAAAQKKPAKSATTITKICDIIEELRSRKSMGVSDLARRMELLPSDVHRILASLQAYGYIDQDLETKKYRLGKALLRIGLTTFLQHEFRDRARPVLARLSELTDATAHLWLFDPKELAVVVIEQAGADLEGRFRPRVGATISIFENTAAGSVVLAHLDAGFAARVAANESRGAASGRHLEEIRQREYAADCKSGTACAGCAILGNAGVVIGAVTVSLPSSSMAPCPDSKIVSVLKNAARELQELAAAEDAPIYIHCRADI